MTLKDDQDMAFKVARSLVANGCAITTLCSLDTGVFEIQYTINGVQQPPVRVHNKSVIFPAGSQCDLMWGTLGWPK